MKTPSPSLLSLALVHYPVVNKHGEVVTTSITNFDLHDLARTSKTYGVSYYIITPNPAQQNMARYIHNYWQEGIGASFNPDRSEAFDAMEVSESIADTCLTIEKLHGKPPTLIATSARSIKNNISFNKLREDLTQNDRPFLLLFGTGWGLAPEVLEKVDFILDPICGVGSYNHLPVRSAVANILDRLLGKF